VSRVERIIDLSNGGNPKGVEEKGTDAKKFIKENLIKKRSQGWSQGSDIAQEK